MERRLQSTQNEGDPKPDFFFFINGGYYRHRLLKTCSDFYGADDAMAWLGNSFVNVMCEPHVVRSISAPMAVGALVIVNHVKPNQQTNFRELENGRPGL